MESSVFWFLRQLGAHAPLVSKRINRRNCRKEVSSKQHEKETNILLIHRKINVLQAFNTLNPQLFEFGDV
jgi:hypothetical protein